MIISYHITYKAPNRHAEQRYISMDTYINKLMKLAVIERNSFHICKILVKLATGSGSLNDLLNIYIIVNSCKMHLVQQAKAKSD